MFAFGMMGSLDPEVSMASLYLVIVFIFFFEFVTGLLEYCIQESPLYNKMVQHIYKELMQMGIVSFLVVLYESLSLSHDAKWLDCIDFAHILLFFFCIYFVIHAFYLMAISVKQSQDYLKMDRKSYFLCLESLGQRSAWSYFLYYFPFINLSNTRRSVEYKIIHVVFQDTYCRIPSDFYFPLYLSKCFDRYSLKVIEVSPLSWFILIVLVGLNFIRDNFHGPLVCLSNYQFGEGGSHEEGGSSHDDGGSSHDDGGSSHVRRLFLSTAFGNMRPESIDFDDFDVTYEHNWKCYNQYLTLFFASAVFLCCYMFVLLVFARYYEHKLICRSGISGSSEYQKFIMYLAQNVLGKAKAKARGDDTVESDGRFLLAEMRKFIEECVDAKEHDEETEFYRSFTEKVKTVYDTVVEWTHDILTNIRLFVKTRLLSEDGDDDENNTKEVLFGSAKVEPGAEAEATPAPRMHAKHSLAGVSRFSRRHDLGKQQSFQGAHGGDSKTVPPATAAALGAIPEGGQANDNKPAAKKVFLGEDNPDEKDEHDDNRVVEAHPVVPVSPNEESILSPAQIVKQRGLSFDSESSGEDDHESPKATSVRLPAALLTLKPANQSPVNVRQTFSLRGSPTAPRPSKILDSKMRGSIIDRSNHSQDESHGHEHTHTLDPHPIASVSSAVSDVASVSVGSDKNLVVERRGSANADAISFVCDKKNVLLHQRGPGRRKSVMGSGTVVQSQTPDPAAHGHSIVEAYRAHKMQLQGPPNGTNGKVEPAGEVPEIVKEDFSDLFFFKDPKHFYRCFEVAIMFNCLYMTFWSTNFIALVSHYSEHVVAYQTLMLIPIVFNFICISNIASVCSMLKAVTECDSNMEVILEVISYMEDRELLINQLRSKIRAKIDGFNVERHKIIQQIFDEIDQDRSGFIDRIEFRTLLRRLDLTYSDSRFTKLFAAVDRNLAGVLSIEDLTYLLFPEDNWGH